jgi:lysophospholipase L1-like esterase
VTPKPPKGKFRVLLFGDSFTAGDGVSNQYRFGDLLERRMPGVEVLNFGLPGSGTDQQYLAFLEYAKELAYDLLVICPMVENIERNVTTHRKLVNFSDGKYVERAKPYFLIEEGALVIHHVPCPREIRATDAYDWHATDNPVRKYARKLYDRYPGFSRVVKRIRDVRYPKAYEDPQSAAWLLMKRILERWVEQSTSDVVICPLPLYSHIDKSFAADGIRRRFAEIEQNPRVTVADILPDYWRMTPAEIRELVYRDDQHPSRRGHEAIAASLDPYVRRFYEQWRTRSES